MINKSILLQFFNTAVLQKTILQHYNAWTLQFFNSNIIHHYSSSTQELLNNAIQQD